MLDQRILDAFNEDPEQLSQIVDKITVLFAQVVSKVEPTSPPVTPYAPRDLLQFCIHADRALEEPNNGHAVMILNQGWCTPYATLTGSEADDFINDWKDVLKSFNQWARITDQSDTPGAQILIHGALSDLIMTNSV